MDIKNKYEASFDLEPESAENLKNIVHSEIEEVSKRFNNGTETLDDLINNYRHFTIRFELKSGIEHDLEVVELKYYLKLVEKVKALLNELDNKDKIINEMGTTMAAICTGLATVREQFEKCYCEFINSDEDCCWKTDKSCKDCIIDYFTKKVSEK